MKTETKYLTRRHLEIYSETQLSKFLLQKGYMVFFPFKDKGIDMVAIKKDNIELYQLKARNEMSNYKRYYWFPIRKNLNNYLKMKHNKNIFFILCALQPNQKDFHFFKIPLKIAKKYFKEKHYKNTKFFEITRIHQDKYDVVPKYVKININKYRLK